MHRQKYATPEFRSAYGVDHPISSKALLRKLLEMEHLKMVSIWHVVDIQVFFVARRDAVVCICIAKFRWD